MCARALKKPYYGQKQKFQFLEHFSIIFSLRYRYRGGYLVSQRVIVVQKHHIGNYRWSSSGNKNGNNNKSNNSGNNKYHHCYYYQRYYYFISVSGNEHENMQIEKWITNYADVNKENSCAGNTCNSTSNIEHRRWRRSRTTTTTTTTKTWTKPTGPLLMTLIYQWIYKDWQGQKWTVLHFSWIFHRFSLFATICRDLPLIFIFFRCSSRIFFHINRMQMWKIRKKEAPAMATEIITWATSVTTAIKSEQLETSAPCLKHLEPVLLVAHRHQRLQCDVTHRSSSNSTAFLCFPRDRSISLATIYNFFLAVLSLGFFAGDGDGVSVLEVPSSRGFSFHLHFRQNAKFLFFQRNLWKSFFLIFVCWYQTESFFFRPFFVYTAIIVLAR